MPEPGEPQFKPEQEPEQEKLSEKEKKEKKAFLEIAQEFSEKTKELKEGLKEDSCFEAKGRKFEMGNEIDLLVASVQSEVKLAREIKEKAEGYYHKKAAAKLAHFLKSREEFLKAYAELKSYYPEFVEMFEEKMPYLKQIYQSIQKKWSNFKKF